MRIRPRWSIPSKSPVHGLESVTLWLDALLVVVVAGAAPDEDANAIAFAAMSNARLRETNGLAILELPD
jgi:hypothetical protein